MSFPFAAKISAGLLVGGVCVSGGSIALSPDDSPRSKKTISELFLTLNKNKKLLDKSAGKDSQEWKRAWETYTADYNTTEESPFFLASKRFGNGSSDNEATLEGFMDKCESLSNSMVEDENDYRYQQVSKYCTSDS
ncbi:hypothetical protein MHF_0285 [Mycoplasma haemofelis Ohio2]|uniref:Uncharacterized protein n=1 Tax=Mycoplasma haemofelis (strain Ohio2) TaxID=859194 RepID=F6FGP4_MYCHI|nr:hypothetical protein MHF_0285 [Mycoplasma haemofelis Ohio2]